VTGDGPLKETEVAVDGLMTTVKGSARNIGVQGGHLFENKGRLNSEPYC